MKRLLTLLVLVIAAITVSAQTIKFETTSYTYKTYNGYSWSKWAPYERSSMLLTMDLNRDLITIYSPKIQIYKILDYSRTYTDNDGDAVMEFKFIDNDGDYGIMRLMQRRSGKSEVYVCFNNVIWVYSVIRL